MSKIWEFYENMNEIVYAADMDTHEIIYMNPKACEAFGVGDQEKVRGKNCYEVLHQKSRPCDFCTNSVLKPGFFHEWEIFNPVVKKSFKLKDTMVEADGRRCRMELAIDMSIQEEQKKTIQKYTSNESMVNEGLRLALAEPRPERSLEVLLAYLGEHLKSERVYIFEENQDGTLDNTFEWCGSDVVPQKDVLQKVPFEVVSLWYHTFKKNKNVIIQDVEGIREEDPLAYEYLKPQRIQALVVSPLVDNGEIIGFYGVDNPPGELLDHISMLFWIVGHFIVSMLKRRMLVNRLEKLSMYDQLTGLGNRHAMKEYQSSLSDKESLGVLYCDVMGLKYVNDTLGHQEGDQLLMRVCECLNRQFGDYALFRIGGDEFLGLCPGICRKELEHRLTLLDQDMEENDARMALGYVWEPQYSGGFEHLLIESDRRMYEDKRRRKNAKKKEKSGK